MKSISLIVVVKGVLQRAMDGLDKVVGVFVDRKNERTFFETNISEEDRRISPVYAEAPKPDWFQIQIPGLPNQLVAVVDNGKGPKVIDPILYKNKKGEDRAKLVIRNGIVVHSWYRKLRAVYFAVQFREGHPFLIVDERFVVDVPTYVNGSAAVEDFLLKQEISGDLAKVAAKLKLSLFDANARPREYKDEKSPNGLNISSKKSDGLPGTVVASADPPTDDDSKFNRKANEPNKSGDGPKGKPKPKSKTKSNRQMLADAKAGVMDEAAE